MQQRINTNSNNSAHMKIHLYMLSFLCLVLPLNHAIAADLEHQNPEKRNLSLKYPIEIIVSDSEIKSMLEEHLPIIYYQKQEKLDQDQIEFLIEDTPQNALDLLKTEGYFNAQVSVTPKNNGYSIQINLGPQTRIHNVSVSLLGDILQDEDLGEYYKNAFQNWSLPVGATFRQSDWSNSKISVLSAVTRKKYPLARFLNTEASINPNTQQAELNISVDSDRPIYFGELQIKGQQRYPLSVIQGLAQFSAGDAYDLDKLLDYQQSLEQDSHYSGASVQADFSQLENDRVPIIVSVAEVKRHKFEAGIRYDSEYGPGGSLGYDYYNLFNHGYIGSFYVEADKYETSVAFGVSQPRQSNGHYLTTNITYTRNTTQKLDKHVFNSGIWYVRDKNGIESRYGVEFIGENAKIPEKNIQLGYSYATMLTASWKRQKIQTLLRPANGYYLDGKIGTTLGKLLSSSMIIRAKASAGYYFTPEKQQFGTLFVRGEIGYIYSRNKLMTGNTPSSLMFRTGGSNSIRGYELDSIGIRLPNSDVVLPDRAMAVASIEYQIPFKKDFALAIFHDTGSVAHTFKQMQAYNGSGIGLRWFSPFAPFSFDIAYGHQDKKIRWHLNLGTRF